MGYQPHFPIEKYEQAQLPQNKFEIICQRAEDDKYLTFCYKRQYLKLAPEINQELSEVYEHEKYPSGELYQKLADKYQFSKLKIENWFKHKRKIDAQQGLIKFPKRKKFTMEEKEKMDQYFETNSKPSIKIYSEISKILNIKIDHIKNYFSYKRKKNVYLSKNRQCGYRQLNFNEQIQEINFKIESSLHNKIKQTIQQNCCILPYNILAQQMSQQIPNSQAIFALAQNLQRMNRICNQI
eukprot:TRINITY_DN7634_c0_g1_i4.p2 TRINITY_DN7634_c0_g1~~TRINITY_DN7634_c0_g1_i4.p2  ORF type:complete len:239 (-),score=39.55 TRINITY_DN7634_c0_g1_i4:110-826(-)